MAEYPQNLTLYLKTLFSGSSKELTIKLQPKEWERFRYVTVNAEVGENWEEFFICDTTDGKHIALNLAKIQVVNIMGARNGD